MIATLEQALKDRLIEYRDAKGLKIVVDTYSGQLDEDLLRELAGKAPAIYVTFSGMSPARKMRSGVHSFEASFVLIVAGKSANDEHARGGGRGGKIVGAFEMIDFSFFATCDLDHELLDRAFEPQRVTNLFNAKVGREYLAVYGLALTCRLSVSADWGIAELDDLETIHHTAAIGGEGSPVMETDLPQTEEEDA
ncbi:phage protein Gp37 [Thalassospira xiamenensis]|uniref:Mu-like prophage protein gp37 n=1 Tax=Thalassospira xiamenensis TaxID=220697 RepID=A0A285TZ94_9PROT|nr:phage protein Gp37 [Thalassospira xiamenensis]SOC28208.1 protein of unknown function [Thalassospira xiamenensis]